MNPVKKILCVHGDHSANQALTLLLEEAGYDVRSFEEPDAALVAVQEESFELALVADLPPETGAFGIVEALKKLRPGLPVLVLVSRFGFPVLIDSIRTAVTDVLMTGDDWALVLRRVDALLRPGGLSLFPEITPARLNEMDAVLVGLCDVSATAASRDDLRAAGVRLRDEAMKLRLERIRLERDRRQLQEEMELLRDQEANLRTYEQRLRTMGAVFEGGRRQSAAPWVPRAELRTDTTLEEAWAQFNRATDMLEAERRSFSGDRLLLQEEQGRMREDEEMLRQREQAVAAREARLAQAPAEAPMSRATFSQAPFNAVRSIFAISRK